MFQEQPAHVCTRPSNSPPLPCPTPQVSVYSVFSYYTNTLYVAVELIDNTTAASAAECATACEKSKCTDWSWCPTDVTGLAGG